jgi:hypothetical protein
MKCVVCIQIATIKMARKRNPSISGKYWVDEVTLLNFSTQFFFDGDRDKRNI